MTSAITAGKRKRRSRVPSDVSSILVPAKQATKQYGLPYSTLRALAFRGEIPVVRLGTAWYFERRDLARFIARSKKTLRRSGFDASDVDRASRADHLVTDDDGECEG
jgi:hypothetical protein